MKNLSKEVGITPPALYNHFKGKRKLYEEAVSFTFEDKSFRMSEALTNEGSTFERLTRFVSCLSEVLYSDPDFRCLMQREMLDGDDSRLKFLVKNVVSDIFQSLITLIKEIDPKCNAQVMAESIIGMVKQHYDFNVLHPYLKKSFNRRYKPQYIADQVMLVLKSYWGEKI